MPGDTIELFGSNSSDPDGDLPLEYMWVYVPEAGQLAPTIADEDTARLTVTFASEINTQVGYTFQLTVVDTLGAISDPVTYDVTGTPEGFMPDMGGEDMGGEEEEGGEEG